MENMVMQLLEVSKFDLSNLTSDSFKTNRCGMIAYNDDFHSEQK